MKKEMIDEGELPVKLRFRLSPHELAAAWMAGQLVTVILPCYAGRTFNQLIQLARNLPKAAVVHTAKKTLRREGLKGVERWLDDRDLQETLGVIAAVFKGRFCMKSGFKGYESNAKKT